MVSKHKCMRYGKPHLPTVGVSPEWTARPIQHQHTLHTYGRPDRKSDKPGEGCKPHHSLYIKPVGEQCMKGQETAQCRDNVDLCAVGGAGKGKW